MLRGASVRLPGARTILGPIDLEVGAGQRWAVLGPNGGGKTTLLRLAGALRQPSSGVVEVLGERLGRVDVRLLRRRIGHVSHAIADRMRPSQPVLDVVLTGRSSTLETWFQDLGEDDRMHAREVLAVLGCAHLATQRFGECSQGERQRVLLARARFARHELLLLDEPAAGLDLPGREALIAAIEEGAGSQEATTILVTHHLEEVPPSTSHVLLLRDGRAVAAGSIERTLDDGSLSETFGIDLRVGRGDDRWFARAARGARRAGA
jgi:iron complex transport system ATP-binding protein